MATQAPFIERLYRSHHGELVGYLANILGSSELAREVAQDAFTKLHATYQPEHIVFPKALLFQIAKRFALMKLRRRRAARKLMGKAVDVAEAVDVPDHQALPCDWQVMTDQIGSRFASAIREIRPDLRCAFVMAYIEGSTLTEIGRALGITEKAVEKRLTKALRLCRENFALTGIVESDFNNLGDLVGLVRHLVADNAPRSAAPPRAVRKTTRSDAVYTRSAKKRRLAASLGLVESTDEAARSKEVAPVRRDAPAGGGGAAPSKRALIAIQSSGVELGGFTNLVEGLRVAVAAARAGRRVKVITLDKERARWIIGQILAVSRIEWPNRLELTSVIRGTSLDSSEEPRDVSRELTRPPTVTPGSYRARSVAPTLDQVGSCLPPA